MRSITWMLCAAAAIGCSGGDDGGDDHGDHQAPQTGCGGADVDTFSAGMTRSGHGEAIQVTIVDAEPAPPVAFDNIWHLEITDSEGTPLEGAEVTIDTFMPEHGHASPKASVVKTEGGGMYTIDPLALPMSGLWRIDVVVKKDAIDDYARFYFCTE